MTLKRQLLLVSLLTLMLPWAGCQFIRETESALREGQQEMLAGTARAVADSMAQYADEFPSLADRSYMIGDQLYGHALQNAPDIDGYFDDWLLGEESLRNLPGADGPIRFAIGVADSFVYLFVHVEDHTPVFADAVSLAPIEGSTHADRIKLISETPPYLEQSFSFAAEAPGTIVPYRQDPSGFETEPSVHAYWRDVARGYQLEARIPWPMLGTHLGLEVQNTSSSEMQGVRSRSFASRSPGAFVTLSTRLTDVATGIHQPGMRLLVTDAEGWRIALAGDVDERESSPPTVVSTWLRFAYDAIVEAGKDSGFADPDPGGREQQPYVSTALNGNLEAAWFRGTKDGRAVVAVAAPVRSRGEVIGAVMLQRDTEEILSLTNETLARLLNVTLITMFLVGGALLGYATVLSRRIRRLSIATEDALESDNLHSSLPSALAADEIGDLSRSFSYVLDRLGDYNDYLRTLASKLSHELRTPLAIVTSSLENLEHEQLGSDARGYTARAKDGAERLRKILSAMGEASRVEEIMKNAEPEEFELAAVLEPVVQGYRDAYNERGFKYEFSGTASRMSGAPELVVQLLDKLVDNAVGFSEPGQEISISLSEDFESRVLPHLRVDVVNPGPPLPERMRAQMFDSMVSMRPGQDSKHLGLGLYVARLIADGHNGRIEAQNVDGGVCFSVFFPSL